MAINARADDIQKKDLKEIQERVIGAKFDQSLSLLKTLDFFNPKTKIDVTIKMLNDLLGVRAFLSHEEDSKYLFARYSTLPKFWSKNAYRTLFL